MQLSTHTRQAWHLPGMFGHGGMHLPTARSCTQASNGASSSTGLLLGTPTLLSQEVATRWFAVGLKARLEIESSGGDAISTSLLGLWVAVAAAAPKPPPKAAMAPQQRQHASHQARAAATGADGAAPEHAGARLCAGSRISVSQLMSLAFVGCRTKQETSRASMLTRYASCRLSSLMQSSDGS